MAHTPGPWTFHRSEKSCFGEIVDAQADPIGFCTYGGDAEAAANGRLMASAPELLAALEVIVKEITAWNSAVELIIGRQPSETWQGLLDARAAIAKATGE